MPYKGSVQSIGFKNRPVADSSKRMRQRAQDLDQQRVETVNEMARVSQGQLDEMRRVDSLKAKKDTYEIQQLAEFSQTLQTFATSITDNVVKPHIDNKRQEGINKAELYAAGDPDTVAEVDANEKQLAAMEKELANFTERTGHAADSLEYKEKKASLEQKYRALNIRQMGTNVAWGFRRGQLKAAGEGYTVHLEQSLVNDDTVIDEESGLKVNDYYNIKSAARQGDRDKILNHVRLQYIKAHSGGLDGTHLGHVAINKYLTKSVVEQGNTFKQKELIRHKREQAYIEIDNTKNNSANAFKEIDGEVSDENKAEIQSIIQGQINSNVYARLNLPGTAGSNNKQMIIEMMKNGLYNVDVDDMQETVEALSTMKFKWPDGTERTLEERWPSDVNWTSIKGDALAKQAEVHDKVQRGLKVAFDTEAEAIIQERRDTGNEMLYDQRIDQLEQKYGKDYLDAESEIAQLKSKTFTVITHEAAKNDMIGLSKKFNGEIPLDLTSTWPMSLKQEIRDGKHEGISIVKDYFGSSTEGKKALLAANNKLKSWLLKHYKGIDKNSLENYDALDALKELDTVIRAEAKEIVRQYAEGGSGTPDGTPQKVSDFEAINMALDKVKRKLLNDRTDSESRYFFKTGVGFVNFVEGHNSEDTYEDRRAQVKSELDAFSKRQSNTNRDLILTEKNLVDKKYLHLSLENQPSPYVRSLALRDPKNRSSWEILKLLRANQEPPMALEIPDTAKLIIDGLNKSHPNLRSKLCRVDSNGRERAIDQMGIVTTRGMHRALGGDNLTLNENEVKALLNETGMTREEYTENPQKLVAYKVNKLVKEASQKTDNKFVLLRMVASVMNGGTMEDWNSPEQYRHTADIAQAYFTGNLPMSYQGHNYHVNVKGKALTRKEDLDSQSQQRTTQIVSALKRSK